MVLCLFLRENYLITTVVVTSRVFTNLSQEKLLSLAYFRLIRHAILFNDIIFFLDNLSVHWSLFTTLETSNKSMSNNALWYVKVCIFWKCIQ